MLDATINLILGVLLLAYSENLATYIGVPVTSNYFYPNILGGIFIGITIALFIEFFKVTNASTGLGFYGAVAINLCGGIVLALWLILGNLNLPMKGQIILWILVIVLIGISSIEFYFNRRRF